ncbi:UNVERIFIED_CONTAM: Dynein light chain 1, cytoplasmic [Gekko kuhli]
MVWFVQDHELKLPAWMQAFRFAEEFDKKYNPTWHCIVGRNFGSYVTHETKHFIYFYLGQVAILLFKSG